MLAGALQSDGAYSPMVFFVCFRLLCWFVYQIMIRSVFLFLDRTYVMQSSGIPSIWYVHVSPMLTAYSVYSVLMMVALYMYIALGIWGLICSRLTSLGN